MGRPRHDPWQDLFAFLLLVSATLVMVIVLLSTRHYYDGLGPAGRALAWVVVALGLLGLASLATMLMRLYITPALQDGRTRLQNGRHRRKRNP